MWQNFRFQTYQWPKKAIIYENLSKTGRKSPKYPPGAFLGGPTKKIFFQKVITHQDATFLGQKFFSKTNILGFWKFLDPLGSKIWKMSKNHVRTQKFAWLIVKMDSSSNFRSEKVSFTLYIAKLIFQPNVPKLLVDT